MSDAEVRVALPAWVNAVVAAHGPCTSDERRMDLTLALARENVDRDLGGPFGAAVFERGGERPVAVGVNSVMRLANSLLHAEVVALMLAHRRIGRHTLRDPELPEHDLFTSCEPCAMCLGASLWSGVRRVVAAATREDALAAGFDEGPVFDASYRYLERRGIALVHGFRREEGRAVLELYRRRGGPIYNG